MVSILFVSHATLASGLLDASSMIVGEQKQCDAISFHHDSNLDELTAAIVDRASALDDGDGVLVLADLLGGSPANTTAKILSPNLQVVTGANLPMALDVLMARRSDSLEELVEVAVASGKSGVNNLYEILHGGDES